MNAELITNGQSQYIGEWRMGWESIRLVTTMRTDGDDFVLIDDDPVISVLPDGVYFNPERMATNRAYAFEYLDHSMVAIKRANESIDFYYIP